MERKDKSWVIKFLTGKNATKNDVSTFFKITNDENKIKVTNIDELHTIYQGADFCFKVTYEPTKDKKLEFVITKVEEV